LVPVPGCKRLGLVFTGRWQNGVATSGVTGDINWLTVLIIEVRILFSPLRQVVLKGAGKKDETVPSPVFKKCLQQSKIRGNAFLSCSLRCS
jgi:hypothetical protein